MLSYQIKELIENRFGQKVNSLHACDLLANDVYSKTGKRIDGVALAAMMGIRNPHLDHSGEYLDTIAQYIEYPNWILVPVELKEDRAIEMTPEEAARYWRWKKIHAEMWRYWGVLLIGGGIAALLIWAKCQ